MSVETVRDWLKREGCPPYKHDPILDARIIRGACKTCGGSGEVATGGMRLADIGGHVVEETERCPDCPPPVVIAPEAFGEVRRLVGLAARECFGDKEEHRSIAETLDDAATRIIQTLYPGARVAREVLECDDGVYERDGKRWCKLGNVPKPPFTIAILEED